MLIYEFSESGEGQLNKMLDFNAILFQSVEKISSYDLSMVSMRQYKECNNLQNQKSFECVQKFLASNSKTCLLPWLERYNNNKRLKICTNNTEELKHHVKLQYKILKRAIDAELENFGCMQKNCIVNKWKVTVMDKNIEFDGLNLNNDTAMAVFSESSNQVRINNKGLTKIQNGGSLNRIFSHFKFC